MDRRQTRAFLLVAGMALVISAWTGVLMRFGMVYGLPTWAQNFGAVRHAHSHLMYFGWVTLALMSMIWADLPRHTGRPLPRGVMAQMSLTAIAALLSFPAFWANGYGLTTVGAARLPLGSMVATLNGLTWIVFLFLYVRATRGLPVRTVSIQLWDWALVLLILASLGAVGLVGVVFSHTAHPFLQQLFLHQFLDLFAVGWFNLAVLGLLWSWLAAQPQPRWLPTFSLALLVTPTFLLGVSPALLSPALFWVAALANGGAAILLGVHGFHLWRRRRTLPPLTWLALMGMASVIIVAALLLWPGVWRQTAGGQLRIFYLHVLLLMWISTALIGQIQSRLAPDARSFRRWVNPLWAVGVLVMIGGLFGLGVAPWVGISQLLWLQVAAWGSLIAAIAMTALLLLLLVHQPAAADQLARTGR